MIEHFQRLLINFTRRPFSRVVLVVTMVMTWDVTRWAFAFAMATKDIGGYDTAAVLVAVTGPFAWLQKEAFRIYTDGKMSDG